MSDKDEIWADVLGFEGLYMISTLGRVRSLDRLRLYKDSSRNMSGRLMKLTKDVYGYIGVQLCKNRIIKKFAVHRLVSSNFIENIHNKPYINHINEVKHDNRLENLEWCTAKENVNHGTCQERKALSSLKPVTQLDKNGNVLNEWRSALEASKNGFSRACICLCCKGKHQTHKGFKWKYK